MARENWPASTDFVRGGPRALGGFAEGTSLYCFFETKRGETRLAATENLADFALMPGKLPAAGRRAHVSREDLGQVAVIETEDGGLRLAVSQNLKTWRSLTTLRQKSCTNGVLVQEYQIDGAYLMILGGDAAHFLTSVDGKHWTNDVIPSLDLGVASDETIEIDAARLVPRGVLVCFRLVRRSNERPRHRVHLALLNPNVPSHVLWRSPTPVWEEDPEWGSSSPAGAAVFQSHVVGFWNTSRFGVMLVRYPVEGLPFELPRDRRVSLERERSNPFLHPRAEYPWEAFATYNPAAFAAAGKVHVLYRAQGHDLVSSIGYAVSTDGVTVDERQSSPVYFPQEVFEKCAANDLSQVATKFMSGGGIAGCEDPRATVIDDRVFMTYVAFDGASPPRVALTSIQLEDFLARRWLWQRPVLISPPGIVDKSAVIFPEKVKGKYVIMHRIFPDILIDYVDDLAFDGSRWLRGEHRIPIREGMWDSRKLGAGAPPIKTPEGWLLIYYGVDDRDPRHYKMGAMLLDLEDPVRVLYRSSSPILEPEDWYENVGFKPGVVYPCGAVVLGEKLLVYYGGADSVVCVASADLRTFLGSLKTNHEMRLVAATATTHRINFHAYPH